MSIEELTDIVPPPENPLNAGPAEKWDAVCNELGTQLPSDLRDLALTYGSGHFANNIMVFNPFDEAYRRAVDRELETLRDWNEGEEQEIPYADFPETRSLLPWGADDQSNTLWWVTEGDPDDWPVILYPRAAAEGEFWRLDMSMTTFLSLLFSKSLMGNPIWHSDLLVYPETRQFTPEPLREWYSEIEEVESKSAYELYRENGNKVGFCVQYGAHHDAGMPYWYYVTSVGGQTTGELPGEPPKHDEVPVIADQYEGDQLTKRDCELVGPFLQYFVSYDPPEGWDAQSNA